MATRHGDTFLNRRRCRFRLPDKCGLHLGEQPRVSLGAPGDHHRVAARLCRHAHGIGTAADVAVAHDGHGHRLAHPSDDAPVGTSPVQLLGEPPVHRDPVGSGLFHEARESGRRLVAFRPAPPELHRDRMLHGPLHGPHDGGGQVGILHERRAVPLRHDLAGGTSHVDVQIGQSLPHLLLDPGGLGGHDVGLVAEQLHGHPGLAVGQGQQVARLLAGEGEPLGRDHLREGHIRPGLAAERPEGDVGHAGHGREQHPVFPEEPFHD